MRPNKRAIEEVVFRYLCCLLVDDRGRRSFNADLVMGESFDCSDDFLLTEINYNFFLGAVSRFNSLLSDKYVFAMPKSGSKSIFITCRHPSFDNHVESLPLPSSRLEFIERIMSSTPLMFLKFCVVYCVSHGCDHVYITDKKGDRGVDCIGFFSEGPWAGMSIICQSKTSEGYIGVSKQSFYEEMGKYFHLLSDNYIKDLVFSLRPGSGKKIFGQGGSFKYSFITNGFFGFKYKGEENNLPVQLVSVKELTDAVFMGLSERSLMAVMKYIEKDESPKKDKNLVHDIFEE